MINNKTPVMLLIFDGFGIRKDEKFNAILNSHMDFYFSLWKEYPHTKLDASGPLVGLPEGQIGSSEVGHLTLGSGRLVKQPIVRINEDVNSGNFFKNEKLEIGLNYVKKNSSNIHLMGLLGPGGVHSHENHLFALIDFWDKNLSGLNENTNVYIHNFLDGRDTAQQSAKEFLKNLENKLSKVKNKSRFINSTLCGRYFAMDRDKRLDRTKKAFELLTKAKGVKFNSWETAMNESYKNKIFDEFVEPVILNLKEITKNDLVQWYNFRSDRPQQLTKMFLEESRGIKIQTLTNYNPEFDVDVLYPTLYPKMTFGEVLSKNKKTQLRIAESEKFPHVTYFFNGLNHKPFKNETQVRISSPKVATYDLMPEMSSHEVTRRVCKEIRARKYDFILLNFANSDMVGHTGNYDAVVSALSTLDKHLKDIKESLDAVNGTLLITADHGNCETMRDENGKPHTKHTYNQVPFVLCDKNFELKKDNKLSLYNVAPTILDLMNIKKPQEMNVESIIKKRL